MVWFRQAARHYQSQCWLIYVAILRHNVLSNCYSINDDSRITDPFVRRNHWWQKKSVMWSFRVCFVVSLNMLDKQLSCPWFKTLWRQCHFVVLTACHFENVVRPQWVKSAKYSKNVNCLAAHFTLTVTNFNFTIQRWEIIHGHLSSAMPDDKQNIESTKPLTSSMSTM